MLDRQDVEDCVKRISRGIDRFDRELFLSGYHADGVIDVGDFVGPPDRVYAAGAELHERGQSATQHYLTNHACEVEGDVAHAETYWLYAGANRDGTTALVGGRYLDRLERRDGAWRIAFRRAVLEWATEAPAAAVALFENVPDLNANGAPARSREDPSYRRPLVNRRATSLA
jgi:hypothetical protein